MSPAAAVRGNRYPGPCALCGQLVPAGAGQLYKRAGRWVVRHPSPAWVGSPVSGRFVGGCPETAPAPEPEPDDPRRYETECYDPAGYWS